MKRVLFVLALLASCAALAQTPPPNAQVFSNIDDTSPWKICVGPCAGGTQPYQYSVTPNVSSPSRDGASTALYVNGPAWTDVLFIRELGPHNSASNFQSDTSFYLSNSSKSIGQAFEFDTFQFINNVRTPSGNLVNVEYMFGTQCDYSQNGGVWSIWSQTPGQWVPQYEMPCVNPNHSKFRPGVWYRIIWNLHRVPPDSEGLTYGGMSYDSVRIIEYGGNNRSVSSDTTYTVNSVQSAGALPAGWSDQLGVQFQVDLNGISGANGYPNSITEWVDSVKLSAW
ncbi:MAG: hypothetical protein ACXVY9_08710 [Terriglobales bacterium]